MDAFIAKHADKLRGTLSCFDRVLFRWFPMQVQVYVNGHERLARKLTRHGLRYTEQDNALLWLEDCRRAQRFADRFASLGWVALLDRDARRVNPLLREVLAPMMS
ncbi:MAG: hypothetical protein ACE5JD_08595 [Candidatus Methylomirabilia bacterium]